MATTKKSSTAKAKKPATKKTAVKTKAPVKKSRKASASKSAAASSKVDYYPNRMTLAIAVLAGTLLVLISLITVLGVQ
jgi:hypothetical protein